MVYDYNRDPEMQAMQRTEKPCPLRDPPPGGNAQPPCARHTSFVDWVKRLISGLGGIAATVALDSDLINQVA